MISKTLYVDRCLTQNAAAAHGAEDLGPKNGLSEVMESGSDPRAADANLEERDARTHGARDAPGFADSLVPTLEEKMAEQGHNLEGGASELDRSASTEARVDSRHLSSASVAPETDRQPLFARVGKGDDDAETLRARGTLRRPQVNTKLGQSPWTIPTPKPKYDVDSFEDPSATSFGRISG